MYNGNKPTISGGGGGGSSAGTMRPFEGIDTAFESVGGGGLSVKRQRLQGPPTTLQLTETAGAGSSSSAAAASGSSMPALARSWSLGSEAARALPFDLQKAALELVDSTELQVDMST